MPGGVFLRSRALEENRSAVDETPAVSKPVFSSVLDLGLRDVGVANQPRRLAAHFGRWTVPVVATAFALAVGSCVLVRAAGGGSLAAAITALTWTAVALALALPMARRSPVVVVKVTAEGRNQATWMVITPFVLLLASSLTFWAPLTIPMAAIAVLTAAIVWRSRGHVPGMLRALRATLGADERVLGDGVGLLPRLRRGRAAVRVIAATDSRLLLAGEDGVVLAVRYGEVARFGIEWKVRGRTGTLSFDIGGNSHVIDSIAPANLLSIAQALRAHGVPADDTSVVDQAQRGWEAALSRSRRRSSRRTRIAGVALAAIVGLVVTASAAGFDLASVPVAVQEVTGHKLPVDGRSNLTGGAAALAYAPGPGLRELRTDEHWDAGPNDGARWELRSSFTKGYNVVSLAHYIFEPRLDDPAAVADFVAGKDGEHARLAGTGVTHTVRVVDGREGYVWEHRDRRGYWHFAAWFPQPVHTVRLECITKKDAARFKRLCAEAMASLRFRR